MEAKRHLNPGVAHCPMCGAPVDNAWLEGFSDQQRMTFARQLELCRLHTTKTVKPTWIEKGYPSIDRDNVAQQMKTSSNQDYVESLIRGGASHSQSGILLQEQIRTGKNKTLFANLDDDPTPGYYGPRGMNLMIEVIVELFSNLLRERASQDLHISARGYSSFLQIVLVPELSIRLIQEVMSLDEGEARKVMEESRAVGELLNNGE